MNRNIILCFGIIIIMTGSMCVAGNTQKPTAALESTAKFECATFLESHIPYDFTIRTHATSHCDALQLEVYKINHDDTITTYALWRVMSDHRWLMTAHSFDELYHRFDGPACYNMTVIPIHYRTGKAEPAEFVHVCLK